jgi:mono/diheme cytochrome c family protein
MMRTASVLVVFLLSSATAFAQGDGLNDKQRHGRQLLAQSCGVCHLPPTLNAKTYGPALNKAAGGGDDDIVREYINNGTPRMPAFKYYLKPDEIEDIIAYVRTVPVPGAAPARPGGGE